MNEQNPGPGRMSLDDLLKANKAQFDKVFSKQMDAAGLLTAGHRPAIATDQESASIKASTEIHDVTANLNGRFGSGWSSEVLEHKTERGGVSVLVKLTAGGESKMQFGSARENGDTGKALQRATDDALAKCADMLPDEAAVTTQAKTTSERLKTEAIITAQPSADGNNPDELTLDLIENSLRNACQEMDAVQFHAAITPIMGEENEKYPMITDPKGRMIVGQFGSYVAEMLNAQNFDLVPGDVILQNDPYKCGGAVSHINDWIILVPVFFDGDLVGFTSMCGRMMDAGSPVPFSMPTAATSIFGEGLRIPPIKLYEQGVLNQAALDLIMNNTRTPEMNYSNLMAILAGSRAGEKRVVELCRRFGSNIYSQACEALLQRTERAMRQLIVQSLPTEPQSFEDYVDDDGCGNGPFKMKLTVWREGEHAYFDWTGTAIQAPGPINFYLHEGTFKMFVGVYMTMVLDPQMLFNDGFHHLIHVTLPKGTLVQPNFPAPLGCRTHTLSRQFDVLGGALSQNAPEVAAAAGYGSSPYFVYSGIDKHNQSFQLMEIVFGGIPGRPIGDGIDGHSWWPLLENIPIEHLETYYPLAIEGYNSAADSGGAGLHRGGNGIEKVYHLLAEGEVSIHDDRHESQPWGILGGRPGAVSAKWLIRKDGEKTALPSKFDNLHVRPGDRVVFRTAGGGGWGNPLERDPEKVRKDVARRLLSAGSARQDYGVVLQGDELEIDLRATLELRESTKRNQRPPPRFNFGNRGANGAI